MVVRHNIRSWLILFRVFQLCWFVRVVTQVVGDNNL